MGERDGDVEGAWEGSVGFLRIESGTNQQSNDKQTSIK